MDFEFPNFQLVDRIDSFLFPRATRVTMTEYATFIQYVHFEHEYIVVYMTKQ